MWCVLEAGLGFPGFISIGWWMTLARLYNLFPLQIKQCVHKEGNGASEIAQRVKALAAKTDDLNLIPVTHMVKGEN